MSSQSKIRWLLIDIGDVLLLKDDTIGKSFGEVLADKLGVDIELAQQINEEHYTTMEDKYVSEADFATSLKNKLGYDAPKGIYKYFEGAYRERVVSNTELMSFLSNVRDQGINTAVLSNTIAIYKGIQREFGINEQSGFDPIVYSWQVGMIKPNKSIFEYTYRKLGVRASEILFIDDKQVHLDRAAACGMQTLQFNTTKSTIDMLRKILGL